MPSAAPQLPLFPADHEQPGRGSDFSVRESTRAKRLSIKVYPRGRVEVVVPKRTRPAVVAAFVAENQEWIARARASFAVEEDPEPFALPTTILLPAIGHTVSVIYEQPAEGKAVRYRTGGKEVVLSGKTQNESYCVAALRRWLSVTARQAFTPWLLSLAELTNIPYENLHIRAQRTCWGSRSSSGTISLNLCLLFLEPELVRYLMIHELCHGRHMNHSKRYWRLVASFEADFKALDRRLSDGWRKVPTWLGLY